MDPDTQKPGDGSSPGGIRKGGRCEDIQPLLFDYMTGELDQGRSGAVFKHLRACDDCRGAATDVKSTLDLLRKASQSQPKLMERLSDDRRARLIRAFMHPVLRWTYVHHTLFSILAAVATTAVIVTLLWQFNPWRDGDPANTGTDPGNTGVVVTIGGRWTGEFSDTNGSNRTPQPP